MKKIFFIICLLFLIRSGYSAEKDSISVKIGYIPYCTTMYDKTYKINNVEYEMDNNGYNVIFSGFAIKGEYYINTNYAGILLSTEYQKLFSVDDHSIGEDDVAQFIIPGISAIFTFNNLYYGIGLAGKYLYDFKTSSDMKENPDKKIDLWLKAIIGYKFDISNNYFIDIEFNIGVNLTNRQFSEIERYYPSLNTNQTIIYDTKYAYDFSIYAGIGYKI